MTATLERRVVGASMAIAAVLTVLVMSHHPSQAHGTQPGDVVHVSMIVLLATLFWALAYYSIRRGVDQPLVLAALVAYALSLLAHFGAATINGFVVPALAARGPDAVGHDVFVLAWEANQALARLGVYATGVAFLAWSVELLRNPGDGRVSGTLIALLGIVAAVAPIAIVASRGLAMDLATAQIVYAVHATWPVAVGVQLARGKF